MRKLVYLTGIFLECLIGLVTIILLPVIFGGLLLFRTVPFYVWLILGLLLILKI